MKLYALTCVYTPNCRGADGSVNSIKIFKTYEEAIGALRAEIESRDVFGSQTKIDEVHYWEDAEPGEGFLMAEWEYEASWEEGLSKYTIHGFIIPE